MPCQISRGFFGFFPYHHCAAIPVIMPLALSKAFSSLIQWLWCQSENKMGLGIQRPQLYTWPSTDELYISETKDDRLAS